MSNFLPTKTHYDIAVSYQINQENGVSATSVSAVFPTDYYEPLGFTPTWEHHRFVGWYTTSSTPSLTPDTTGSEVLSTDVVKYDVHEIHARWQLPTTVVFDATTNGGQMPDGWVSPDYYVGQQYGTLPIPIKNNAYCKGWYDENGEKVTSNSIVALNASLSARYLAATFATALEVKAYNSYMTVGIYSAERIDSSTPIAIDWGDGNIDIVDDDISELVHIYSSTGTYSLKISDNIKSLAMSSNLTAWYQVTTNNNHVVRKIANLSPNISSIPNYGFYHCDCLQGIYAGSSGNLTLGTSVFRYCAYSAEVANDNIEFDFSGRSITAFLNYSFANCSYLNQFDWPQNCTSTGAYAFGYNSRFSSIIVPEGITILGSGTFRSCTELTSITFPSTLTSTTGYSYYGCLKLSSITSYAMIAPTVSLVTFGNSTSTYTGRNTYSSGTNKLYVPAGATGYDSSYWVSVLLDSTKCGFTKEEIQA